MTNSKNKDQIKATIPSEDFVPDLDTEESQEEFRDYYEWVRPLQRARVQKALADAKDLAQTAPDSHGNDAEMAVDFLQRYMDCLADEPLTSSSSDALDFDDWFYYDELRYQHGVTGNMVMLIKAFSILVYNDITPGRWILEPLAEAFSRIIEDGEISGVASRLGLENRGSGARSPFQEDSKLNLEMDVIREMRILIDGLGVSQMNAANAVKEKSGSEYAPKTLVNEYRKRFKVPDTVAKLLDKYPTEYKDSIPKIVGEKAHEILDSFPQSAQKYLEQYRPGKT